MSGHVRSPFPRISSGVIHVDGVLARELRTAAAEYVDLILVNRRRTVRTRIGDRPHTVPGIGGEGYFLINIHNVLSIGGRGVLLAVGLVTTNFTYAMKFASINSRAGNTKRKEKKKEKTSAIAKGVWRLSRKAVMLH